MALTERRFRLKELLLRQDKPLTAQEIAKVLGTNERIVRYDLRFVEDALAGEGYRLMKKPGVGIWVERQAQDKVINQEQDYIYSQQERKELILFLLLIHGQPLTTIQLAKQLDVSESTLFEDLRHLQVEAKEYHLSLCSKRGIGYWIEGEETKRRNASVEMFTRLVQRAGPLSRFLYAPEEFPYPVLYKYVHEEIIHQLENIADQFVKIGKKHGFYLYEQALHSLLFYIVILIDRCRKDEVITELARELEPIREHRYYQSMQTLFQFIEQQFHLSLPEAECVYLTVQLLGAKFHRFAGRDAIGTDDDWELAVQVATEFIQYLEARLGIQLDDEELLTSLVLHLKSSLYRLKYDMVLHNPLLNDIKKRYSSIYDMTKKASRYLEQILRKRIPEEEVGYLTIHVGAAIERKKQRQRVWRRVAIVCGSGIGTSGLLTATLKSHFPQLEIVDVFTSSSMAGKSMDQIDFVITTIPLPDLDIPTLQVSPILTLDELHAIEKQLLYMEKMNIDSTLGNDGGKLPVLKDVLDETTIRLDLEAADWREATRLAGELLVQVDAVEPRYVEDMIRSIEELGPYSVIAPGVAMPHARPEDGVKRVCLSFVRLKEPVLFGNEENDPVKLVFALGGVDHESHLKVMAQLALILDSPEAMHRLYTGDLAQILAVIAHYSQK